MPHISFNDAHPSDVESLSNACRGAWLLSDGVALYQQRDGTVIDEFDVHHGAEFSCLDLVPSRTKAREEVFVQRNRDIGSCRIPEAGAAPLARVTVQRELRYHEQGTSDLRQVAVHPSLVVGEQPQARHLLDHPVDLGRRVAVGEADEQEEPDADPTGDARRLPVSADPDFGPMHPLQQHTHPAFSPRRPSPGSAAHDSDPMTVHNRLALHTELVPRSGTADADAAFLDACVSWLGLEQTQTLAWDAPTTVTLEGGRILRWAPFRDGAAALADIVVHAPDPLDRSLEWSTHVTYLAHPVGSTVRRSLMVRVGTSGGAPSGTLPPVRPPRLLMEIDHAFVLVSNDGPFQRVPTQLEGGTLDAFVRYVLCDPARTVPVLLLTELPEGDYVIPPEQFGTELFGLGTCFVLRHADTFALSDAVGGHARSVFLGSARAYLPGFSLESDPFQHPLVLARALALPGERRRLVQRLAEVTVQRAPVEPREVLAMRHARADAYARRADAAEAMLATEPAEPTEAEALLAVVHEARDAVRVVHGELGRLREQLTETRDLLEQERAASRALRTTLAAAKERQPVSKPASDAPVSVLEAVERAQALYGDALRFLPTAFSAARESTFPDPDTAWKYLKTLGEVGRRRQDRALSRPLAEVFTDLGVDYSPSVSDNEAPKYPFRDGDHDIDCADQLRQGNNPASCLRIYFTSSDDGGFVIGHVGRHLDALRAA